MLAWEHTYQAQISAGRRRCSALEAALGFTMMNIDKFKRYRAPEADILILEEILLQIQHEHRETVSRVRKMEGVLELARILNGPGETDWIQ